MTPAAAAEERIRQDLLRPLSGAGAGYCAAAAFCALIVAAGAVAWGLQIDRGMVVTGLARPVYWGFYIVNFVFWIGISHAGTLISAILRLTDAGWRKPVTRAAEAITLFALMIGGMFPLIHLGRVWLFYWLLPYPNERLLWPNFRSPLVWDMTAIDPDLPRRQLSLSVFAVDSRFRAAGEADGGAALENLRAALSGLERRGLSMACSGTGEQADGRDHSRHRGFGSLGGRLRLFDVFGADVAFDDLRALFRRGRDFQRHRRVGGRDGRHSKISAAGKLSAARSLRQPGKLLLLMSVVWLYFTASEHLTVWYGNNPLEMNVFQAREHGGFGLASVLMVVCNFAIPFVLLGIRKLRTIPTIVFSGFSVLAGMWLSAF